jgi:D-beta-D-heptose 7-phosphate kinase/D-beta-D-heptose 1-phosphate adenosyltransferase
MLRSGASRARTGQCEDEGSRAYVLGALSAVDLVLVFDEDTPAATIAALKPDLLVKGADYTMEQVVGAEIVRAAGGRVLLLPLMRGHCTTSLIHRAAEHEEGWHPMRFQAADS